MNVPAKHVHCIVKLKVVHGHYIAKDVQGGGSLQNVYKRWFIASECFRAGATFPDLTQLFQLRPILPHHQYQHIIEGPYFPLISLQTKSRHPRLVIGKTSFASPPVSFRLVTMHHGLITLKYGRNTTLKRRDQDQFARVLTSKYGRDKTKIWPAASQWMQEGNFAWGGKRHSLMQPTSWLWSYCMMGRQNLSCTYFSMRWVDLSPFEF